MTYKIVFMGSPLFAVRILEALITKYKVVGVVTQPDKPAGRGRNMTPPPVKEFALASGISVIQPARLKESGVMEQLTNWNPDVIVVAAFGQILRQNVLDLPRYGCINVHASLLPRWRGAAPIQAALLHGDAVTGATIMKMDAGVDTGDILAIREVAILPGDNAASLTASVAQAGAELLVQTLPAYLSGALTPSPQDHSLATFAPMLQKEQGQLDFSRPVQQLVNQVRAFNPWPGAFITWPNLPLKIHAASAASGPEAAPGTRAVLAKMPALRALDGWLLLEQVQPAGKKPMSGRDFLAGARGWQD